MIVTDSPCMGSGSLGTSAVLLAGVFSLLYSIKNPSACRMQVPMKVSVNKLLSFSIFELT